MFRLSISKKDILLCVLTAVLVVIAFPNIEWATTIWVSLVPFLVALEKKSPKEAFWMGLGVGYLITLGAFYWIAFTLHEFGEFPWIVAILFYLIFASVCNIQFAVFAYLYRKLPIPLSPLIYIPILFTAVEYLVPQLFHWQMGACLYKKLWLIQFAELTGVYGATFLVVLVNSCIYELIRWIKKDLEHFPTAAVTVTTVCLVVSGFYSLIKLRDYNDLMKQSPAVSAALVQTNIGNLDKRAASLGYAEAVEYARSVNEKLVLEAAKHKDIDLIILPETSVPGYFTPDRQMNREIMFNLSSRANVPILFGGYNKSIHPDETRIYNSIFLISNFFQVVGSYDKIKLLMFGEYLPFSSVFPFLKRLAPAAGDFSPGNRHEIFTLTKELKLIPLICFEGIFPNFVRQFSKLGGRCLVVISNDSWFGNTACPYQHLMLHVWRTIENRTPMLRAANTGISAVVDLTGKIQSQAGIGKEAVLVDKVSIIDHQTFYSAYGDVFMMLVLLSLVVFVIIYLGIQLKSD